MSTWNCPLDNIDSDIRELVRISFNNGMYPYMSCSGSYRDHEHNPNIPYYGNIELLDSEYIRELIAILLNDKNFLCKIKKARETSFYDNLLPTGLRFEIAFENARGNVESQLIQLFNDVISGKKSLPYDRKRVDFICELLSKFNVRDGSQLSFLFNSPIIDVTSPKKDNYAIVLTGKKNTSGLIDEISSSTDGIEQDDRSCTTIYGSDIVTIEAVLKKVILTYPKLPSLKHGEKSKILTLPNRENLFLKQYNSHLQEAIDNCHKIDLNGIHFNIDDLLL